MAELYQHELVKQLATEFGLPEITEQDLYEDEIIYLLKAVETERVNPKHYPPARWVQDFFTFLRQTGKSPEILESPRAFARQIIGEMSR